MIHLSPVYLEFDSLSNSCVGICDKYGHVVSNQHKWTVIAYLHGLLITVLDAAVVCNYELGTRISTGKLLTYCTFRTDLLTVFEEKSRNELFDYFDY